MCLERGTHSTCDRAPEQNSSAMVAEPGVCRPLILHLISLVITNQFDLKPGLKIIGSNWARFWSCHDKSLIGDDVFFMTEFTDRIFLYDVNGDLISCANSKSGYKWTTGETNDTAPDH